MRGAFPKNVKRSWNGLLRASGVTMVILDLLSRRRLLSIGVSSVVSLAFAFAFSFTESFAFTKGAVDWRRNAIRGVVVAVVSCVPVGQALITLVSASRATTTHYTARTCLECRAKLEA